MLYESTRGKYRSFSSAEAIKTGIAPDGGLFVPESGVNISLPEIKKMSSMNYNERTVSILQHFLTDYTKKELFDCAAAAYNQETFDAKDIVPVHKLDRNVYVMELWHGPTCAFKDMALQIMPRFLSLALDKTGERDDIVILVATSGDTGKAALEGFKDVSRTKIVVFYPQKGISTIQKLQMDTQEGENVHVVAVQGNFDDTQSGVKDIFGGKKVKDALQKRGLKFSSANSINWGRLAPQIVYYFSAYSDLLSKSEIKAGEKINFVVPTGNFGNILAGFYARQMGLPVHRLVCAANANNVLTDFIKTGTYNRNRQFKKTISPSMDILISSNLERLLYELTGRDAGKIKKWMAELTENGIYTVDPDTRAQIEQIFWSDFASDEETIQTIRETYYELGYLLDTHTAVGKNVYDKYKRATGDRTKTVIASTASPFKFNQSVARAILGDKAISGKSEFELLDILSRTSKLPVPAGLRDLHKKPVRHNTVTSRENMKSIVLEILGANSGVS